jgi:hypothetical protein
MHSVFPQKALQPPSMTGRRGLSLRSWPGFILKLECIFKVFSIFNMPLTASNGEYAEANLFKRTKDNDSPTGVYLADKLKVNPWWMDVVPNVCITPPAILFWLNFPNVVQGNTYGSTCSRYRFRDCIYFCVHQYGNLSTLFGG